jgi:hypothetical protein
LACSVAQIKSAFYSIPKVLRCSHSLSLCGTYATEDEFVIIRHLCLSRLVHLYRNVFNIELLSEAFYLTVEESWQVFKQGRMLEYTVEEQETTPGSGEVIDSYRSYTRSEEQYGLYHVYDSNRLQMLHPRTPILSNAINPILVCLLHVVLVDAIVKYTYVCMADPAPQLAAVQNSIKDH